MSEPTAASESLPDIYLPHNLLCEQTMYMNCGYWKENPTTFDEAAQALVELVVSKANPEPGAAILDVGFGYGDQDAFLMNKYQPSRIVGINLSAFQAKLARERFAKEPWAARVDFRAGDAIKTDLPTESMDIVLAIDCSAAFQTRALFLKEAFRVLKPKGRIALCDPLLVGADSSLGRRVVARIAGSYFGAPRINLCTLEGYEDALRTAGFATTGSMSIGPYAYPPSFRLLRRKVERNELPERMDKGIKTSLKALAWMMAKLNYPSPLDYGLAWGTKLG